MRFLTVVVVGFTIMTVYAVVLISFSHSGPAPTGCPGAIQDEVADDFKASAITFGLLGAAFAALFYIAVLRYQIFFSSPNIVRVLIAVAIGTLAANTLTVLEVAWAADCLHKALNPTSPVAPSLPPMHSLAGNFLPLWSAIVVDQLLIVLSGTGVAAAARVLYLRAAR